jgi:hypothetical protein
MKRSSSRHEELIRRVEHRLMETTGRHTDDLLEVARVLLLLQGAILVATTIEALIWSLAFGGAAGVPLVLSGATAAVILVARARLRADRRRTRRLVYVVEGVTLATLALDTALAIALTNAFPPPVALLTRLVLPLSVILLLRRSARASAAPIAPVTVAAVEVMS